MYVEKLNIITAPLLIRGKTNQKERLILQI